jgi:protein involved in polysaccharide export with SLBB domain
MKQETFVKFNLLLGSLLIMLMLCGCATHEIVNYPLYTDQVAKTMEKQTDKNTAVNFENEIPDMSKIPNYMAPGFSFKMSHPSDNKLSGTFRADFNGTLQLPYDVMVNVNNKTFSELKDEVLTAYQKFFTKGVESVNFILAKREYWVEVRGLVKKPGRFLIRSTDSLDLVVNAAGGVQGDIGVDYYTATLKQKDFEYQVLLNKYFESSDIATKIRWLGGDSIFISKLDSMGGMNQEIPFVTVIGGVIKPGKVLYQKNAGLFYFIEKSGGTIPGLGYNECYIFRNTREGVKRIQFSFNHPETIPMIFPNDTIFMNSQIKTPGDIFLEHMSQVAGIISTAALLIIAL